MDFKVIYEDNDVLVVDKPAGVVVFLESTRSTRPSLVGKTLIDYLLEQKPELKSVGEATRHGIVHRLDKDTSGILLVAKNNESLLFLQKQFKSREVEKKYMALANGIVKEEEGRIETLIGRSPADPRKQKAFPRKSPAFAGKREAITEYKVLERFDRYSLLEVKPKTGRKHQIRCHLAYIHHPIAGDKMYGFKDSPVPKGLNRQFLHSSYLKIRLPNGSVKEFNSDLPEDLKKILNNFKI
ncbi:MAG: RluA family pseudouridine synthase [Patescibacteria group bacterium]